MLPESGFAEFIRKSVNRRLQGVRFSQTCIRLFSVERIMIRNLCSLKGMECRQFRCESRPTGVLALMPEGSGASEVCCVM